MKALNITGLLAAMIILLSGTSYAHCDGVDGPVISAAKKALNENNVNLVLIWVRQEDEQTIRDIFQKTLALRNNPDAKELAEKYFFDTLVRLHRMGEGAPFTGVKPAGFNNDPSVLGADKSIESSSLKELYAFLAEELHNGLHRAYEEAESLKNYEKNDVEAGRKYVAAYIKFLHYTEGVYKAAKNTGGHHEHTVETD